MNRLTKTALAGTAGAALIVAGIELTERGFDAFADIPTNSAEETIIHNDAVALDLVRGNGSEGVLVVEGSKQAKVAEAFTEVFPDNTTLTKQIGTLTFTETLQRDDVLDMTTARDSREQSARVVGGGILLFGVGFVGYRLWQNS